jgi:hypothetical protein
MSTEHNAGYCTIKDKMILTRGDAHATAHRLKGMVPYQCEECKGWHIARRKRGGTKRIHRNNATRIASEKFHKKQKR